MNEKKIYSLLGFAARARKLSFGKERIRGYIRSDREKKLIVVARDASARLKKDLEIRTKNIEVTMLEMFTKAELGKLLGKAEVSAVAVEDDGIIDGIIREIS